MDSQMTFHFGRSDGERVAYDCCYWIKAHGDAFKAMMAYCHRQVDDGNPRTTRDDVMAWARDNSVGMSVLDDLVRDHNLFACVTRYAVMLRPRLAKTLRFRKSKLDKVDLAAIWHEVVNAGTTFLASDRFEAELMADTDDAAAA